MKKTNWNEINGINQQTKKDLQDVWNLIEKKIRKEKGTMNELLLKTITTDQTRIQLMLKLLKEGLKAYEEQTKKRDYFREYQRRKTLRENRIKKTKKRNRY